MKIGGNVMMSGRYGNLVYYIRNGKCFAREYVEPNDPKTFLQRINRTKLKVVNEFLSKFTKVIKSNYQTIEGVSSYNEAMKYHMRNALTQTTCPEDENPSFIINYNKVQLALGYIQPPEIYRCERNLQVITLEWNNRLGAETNRHNDVLMLVAYTPGLKVLVNNMVGIRAEGNGEMQLPGLYSNPVHLYAFYWNNHKPGKTLQNASNSIYLGLL